MKMNKKFTKISTLLFAFVLAFTMLMPVTSQAAVAVKSVNFSTKEKTTVLVLGTKYKLSYTLSPTNAKSKVTYTSSNKKIATVDANGNLTPVKAGEVTVTAKTANGKSKAIKYLVVDKNGTTSAQAKLDKMLAASNVKTITIKNADTFGKYTIKAGTYSTKTLVVNAPLSDVTNNAVFKSVTIKDVKNGTWTENAKNNKFSITDRVFSFKVAKGASVADLKVNSANMQAKFDFSGTVSKMDVTGKNANIKLNADKNSTLKSVTLHTDNAYVALKADGKMENVLVDGKTKMVVTGETKNLPIEVSKNAAGTELETSVPVELKADTNMTLILEKGAEASNITVADTSVKLNVTNDTAKDLVIHVEGSTSTITVKAGETEQPKTPEDTNNNNSGSNSGGSTTTTKTVTGTSGSTSTYTLPVAFSNLKSAVVKVTDKSNNQTSYAINNSTITYVASLLSAESINVDLWSSVSSFTKEVTTGKNMVISGNGATKTVTFDGKTYSVTVNKADSTVTITKSGSSVTYTLSKSGNTLTIASSDTNEDVSQLVTFVVTY